MRVIAGSAKRIKLETVEGTHTRPTTDRIKETLFNMLQSQLADSNFLDLFSGSGAIGIEALSRGASKAVFIENNKEALSCIRKNLHNTNLEAHSMVINKDVTLGLAEISHLSGFEYIFMDPPYDMELEKEVLMKINEYNLLIEDGIIIIEASLTSNFEYVNELGYELIKEKKYKTNKHLFLEKLRG